MGERGGYLLTGITDGETDRISICAIALCLDDNRLIGDVFVEGHATGDDYVSKDPQGPHIRFERIVS